MRTTSTIITLTILAIALGLLLTAGLSATAAPPATAIPAPKLIDLAVHGEPNGSGSTLYRLWDDGLTEINRRNCDGCAWSGWSAVPE